MSQGLKPKSEDAVYDSIRRLGDDHAEIVSVLYDAYAPVVFGFISRNFESPKAEELLQAVFLSIPAKLHEFAPEKGRLLSWILRLTRAVIQSASNSKNQVTGEPIRKVGQTVHESDTNPAKQTAFGQPGSSLPARQSVLELLYVKGYSFAQVAAELGIEEHAVQSLVRTELITYRQRNPNA